jgi:Extensin-like protein C-terminus
MLRDARKYLVVSGLLAVVLAVLAGCARSWLAEREPWRGEAEAACLKSGAVKEGSAITILRPIAGPGVCGADFPLRVTALGEPGVLGFADEPVRPPGAILGAPDYAPPPPAASYTPYPARGPYAAAPAYPPAQAYTPAYPSAAPGEPLSIAPSGPAYGGGAPQGGGYAQSYQPDVYPQQRAPAEAVPLGRPAAPAIAAGPATLTPAATLACPLVSTLDRYFSDSVQPAALRWFGQPVAEIKQISAYSCRGMNGDPNAHISEHAFGNALDIAAFVLADGRKITVKDGWHGSPEEQGFLHDVQGAACQVFTTVLAPGSNAYHYDHMHVDLMRRTSGRVICQPAAIPGEVAAARAGGRYSRGRPGEAPYTGSIGSPLHAASRATSDRPMAYDDDDRPHSRLPGED